MILPAFEPDKEKVNFGQRSARKKVVRKH